VRQTFIYDMAGLSWNTEMTSGAIRLVGAWARRHAPRG
jgi:hypothetical protein